MRSWILLTCSVFLFAAAGHALPIGSHASPSPGERVDSDLPIFDSRLPVKADPNLLYYTLGSDPVPSRVKELEFRIEVDGRPYLEEKIPLPPDAAGATFEILAGDADRREHLRSLSQGSHQVRISVLLDGRVVRKASFRDLVASSREVTLLPRVIRSSAGAVRTFAPESEETLPQSADPNFLKGYYDQACVNSCDAMRTSCVATQCPQMFFCEYCENEYASCMDSCWICTDPKSVTNTSYSSIQNVTWVGSSCYHPPGYHSADYIYDHLLVTVRTYHVQRTEYCNGSVVESVLYYTDSYGSCNHPTGISCSYPSGTAYNICY